MNISFVKPSIFLFFFFSLLYKAYAKDNRLFVSTSFGYHLGFSKDQLNIQNTYINHANITSTDTNLQDEKINQVFYSLGEGKSYNLNLGVHTNTPISFLIGYRYMKSKKSVSNKQYINNSSTTEINASSNQFLLGIRYSYNVKNFITGITIGGIYNKPKVGIVFDEKVHDMHGNFIKYKLYGNMSAGYFANLHTAYNLYKNLSLFGELDIINLNYAPQYMYVEEHTFNETDVTDIIYSGKREYTFSRRMNNNATPDKILQRIKIPYSSIGFCIGLRLNLFEIKQAPNAF